MRILNIVGARPQFVKLAPILQAVDEHNRGHPDQLIEEILVHTGQHYDYLMSQVFFEELRIKEPDIHLGIGSGTHAFQTGEMLKGIEGVLFDVKPDTVLVYGDTNTTLAGALAAAKLHISLAHIEAGLRSFNRNMPEEINRIVTDHISDLLFCPTATSVENLLREGISNGVHIVGDVMYDSLLLYSKLAEKKSSLFEWLGLKQNQYALSTIHRSENTDDPDRLGMILQGLNEIGKTGLIVVLPLHPRTGKQLATLSSTDVSSLPHRNLRIIEPVSYLDMLMLEKRAKFILTDSGGVQKEAFFFGVPCFTLREETEWVETIELGWNVIVGCNPKRIVDASLELKPGFDALTPYGDGHAATKIIDALVKCKKEA